MQGGADWAGLVRFGEVFAQVDDFDAGHGTLLDTRGEREQFVFSAARVMIGFERWGRRAQQRGCVFHFCAYDGDVAAVVTGSFFLLVTALLLFIDDDEAEIFERRKNCGTRADDHARFAVAYAPPFTCALDIAQRGVQHGNTFKSCAEPSAALTADP